MENDQVKILKLGKFRVVPGIFGTKIIVIPPKILQMIKSRYSSPKQIEFFITNTRKTF